MNRASLLLVTLALVGCHGCADKLVTAPDPRCGEPCYGGGDNLKGKGQCNYGTWVCPEDGGEVACEGWGRPAWETCDDIDNDCDGKVDQFYEPCTNECGSGEHGCRDGQWGVCWKRDSYGFMQPLVPRDGGEICNGIDDDCDGIVDDNLPVVFCYDAGAPATAAKGVCHPGTEACNYGSRSCENQQGPTAEACDGLDNDCNGAVDDGLGHQYDFLFCIDTSGSMEGTIETVKQVVAQFSVKYNSDDHHFALCRIDDIEMLSSVWIMHPFTTAPAFIASVNMLSTDFGYGNEASADALWDASQMGAVYAKHDGGTEALNWRPGARRYIFLFSDELAQTFPVFNPGTPNIFDGSVIMALRAAGVQSHVWTGTLVFSTYTPSNADNVHDIYSPTLGQDLNGILSSACE